MTYFSSNSAPGYPRQPQRKNYHPSVFYVLNADLLLGLSRFNIFFLVLGIEACFLCCSYFTDNPFILYSSSPHTYLDPPFLSWVQILIAFLHLDLNISKVMREIYNKIMRKSSSNTNPSSHFQTSRFLLGLSVKASSDTNPSASPNSVLETKLFSPIVNHRKTRPTWYSAESRPVGLGIVDALLNEKPEIHRKCSNPDSRMVQFGSQLKIKIPSIHPNSVTTAGWTKSPSSPIEFGFNNKSSYLSLPSSASRSLVACLADMWPPSTDMELSEDYTCVIAHGPNPRTTHIFDNCIVESCSADHSYVPSPKEKRSLADDSVGFFAFCHTCMKDIFVYRREKAFRSNECRHNEMMFGERINNP